jgi:hypothetical protein
MGSIDQGCAVVDRREVSLLSLPEPRLGRDCFEDTVDRIPVSSGMVAGY